MERNTSSRRSFYIPSFELLGGVLGGSSGCWAARNSGGDSHAQARAKAKARASAAGRGNEEATASGALDHETRQPEFWVPGPYVWPHQGGTGEGARAGGFAPLAACRRRSRLRVLAAKPKTRFGARLRRSKNKDFLVSRM